MAWIRMKSRRLASSWRFTVLTTVLSSELVKREMQSIPWHSWCVEIPNLKWTLQNVTTPSKLKWTMEIWRSRVFPTPGIVAEWPWRSHHEALTIYALFGDDFRLCVTHKQTDELFNALTLVSWQNCVGQKPISTIALKSSTYINHCFQWKDLIWPNREKLIGLPSWEYFCFKLPNLLPNA